MRGRGQGPGSACPGVESGAKGVGVELRGDVNVRVARCSRDGGEVAMGEQVRDERVPEVMGANPGEVSLLGGDSERTTARSA